MSRKTVNRPPVKCSALSALNWRRETGRLRLAHFALFMPNDLGNRRLTRQYIVNDGQQEVDLVMVDELEDRRVGDALPLDDVHLHRGGRLSAGDTGQLLGQSLACFRLDLRMISSVLV